VNTGAEIDLDITNVAHGGVFVGRHEGRVIFAPDTIPGERVRVRLTETGKASFWRAETVEVLDESPHRLPHIWPDADISVAPERRPGGADFGHIELAHQRELKKFVLADSLQRMAGLEQVELRIEPAGVQAPGADAADEETVDGSGWRTRLSLHVDEHGRAGPYAARSHRVIEVGSHPLAVPGIESVALTLGGLEPGRIDLVQGSDGMVRLLSRPETSGRRGSGPRGGSTNGGAPAEPRQAARGKAKGRRARTRPVAPPVDPQLFATIVERVGAREFQLDAGGFWQVHRLAPATLTAAVQAAVATVDFDAEASNLDLYGGVGLLAAALGDVGGAGTRVTSIEADARATEHAGENLAE
jgi:tRNA/tmRNA/rRNA uracil-C5-methylase (TrmA/RlmC/RlmD family)